MIFRAAKNPTLLGLLVSCLGLGACSPFVQFRGQGRIDSENDRLREVNLDLQRRVEDLEKSIQLRIDQIEAIEQRVGNRAAVKGAQLPALARVRFGRFSGAVDTDGDSTDDEIVVYLHTLDQRGRFLLVAGQAHLQAVDIRPGAEPKTAAEKTFDPPAFDLAYRTGMTGTHFTLKASLASPLPAGLKRATVKITFTDAASGVTLSHEKAFPIAGAP